MTIIYKLKVTKQSLNRVLRDLIKSKMIKQVKDDNDTRKKNLFLDKEGRVFFDTVYKSKKKESSMPYVIQLLTSY